MRQGEIANLKKRQVTLDEVRIVAGQKKKASYFSLGFNTKTNKPRIVPISAKKCEISGTSLRDIVKRLIKDKDPDEHLFQPDRGRASYRRPYYDGQLIIRKLAEACRRAGVPYGDNIKDENGRLKLTPEGLRWGITFHCFKTTRVTRWIELGYSDELISMAVGTTDLKTLREHYVRMDPGTVMFLVDDSGKKEGTELGKSLVLKEAK